MSVDQDISPFSRVSEANKCDILVNTRNNSNFCKHECIVLLHCKNSIKPQCLLSDNYHTCDYKQVFNRCG